MTFFKKHGVLILVFGLPILSVIGGISMLILAQQNKQEVVQDQWYKTGKVVAQDFSKEQLAKSLNVTADIKISNSQNISLKISPPEAAEHTDTLVLNFRHPANALHDRSLQLKPLVETVYHGQLEQILTHQRYHVSLSNTTPNTDNADAAKQWRINRNNVIINGPVNIILSANSQ